MYFNKTNLLTRMILIDLHWKRGVVILTNKHLMKIDGIALLFRSFYATAVPQ